MDIRDAAQVIEEVGEFSYLGFNNGELVQIDKRNVSEESSGKLDELSEKINDLSTDVTELNEDLINFQKMTLNKTYKTFNIKLERGTLDGDQNKVDSPIALRTSSPFSINEPTVLMLDKSRIGKYKLMLYEIDSAGKKSFLKEISGGTQCVLLKNVQSTYNISVRYFDGSTVMNIDDFNYFTFIETFTPEYPTYEFNVSILIGSIVNESVVDYGDSSSNVSSQVFHFNNGYVKFNNPNEYAIIVYEVDKNFNKINRMVVYNNSYFQVKETSYYLVTVYKSGLSVAAREYKNFSGVFSQDEPCGRCEEIHINWEQGGFDGDGNDTASDLVVRTPKIEANSSALYLVILPNEMKSKINYEYDWKSRENIWEYFHTSYSFKGVKNFFRIAVKLSNNADLQVTNKLLRDVHLYKILTEASEYDVVVNASNSKDLADISCNGVNDQQILQGLTNSMQSIKILLNGGTYHLTRFYETIRSSQKSALYTNELTVTYKKVTIHGKYKTRCADDLATRIICNFSEDWNTGEYSAILVPRHGKKLDTVELTNTILEVDGISIVGCGYKKPITYLDSTYANASIIKNVMIRGDGSVSGIPELETTPNVDCVGIRAGYGSNNGIQQNISNCMVLACGKGFSVCGEHFVIEDCLAHHCYIGFAFGDKMTRINYEHPNVMIGCSIEACYRLMLLSRYGETVERESDYCRNTLICIGLSTEPTWWYPLDSEHSGQTTSTLPILEVIKGAYRGRIELDYDGKPFESGSGTHMKYTVYNGNGILEG